MSSDNVAHALSGALGGIISMSLTYPLITVSTRNQVSKDSKKYKGQLDCFQKIISEEGIPGLYSGLNSALFGIAITQGIYYYFYESAKTIFEKNGKTAMTTLESMAAGCVAGVATSLATNPVWVVNTRLTVAGKDLEKGEGGRKGGVLEMVLAIVKEEGVGGFYKGVLPALVLVSNPIIQYTVFEKLKERLAKSKELGSLDFFVLGALSKLAATSITYPYILIKSRLQLKQDAKAKYLSLTDGFRKIIKEEGVQGLYKGIESKLLQSVLTAALLFSLKEELFGVAVKLLVLMNLRPKALNK